VRREAELDQRLVEAHLRLQPFDRSVPDSTGCDLELGSEAAMGEALVVTQEDLGADPQIQGASSLPFELLLAGASASRTSSDQGPSESK